MTFTTSFSLEFAQSFARFPQADQLKITVFQTQFESYGLANFSNYPGKIACSWGGNLMPTDPAFQFAHANELWHYHIGIPRFTPSPNGRYSTSDWVLHFQWPDWPRNGTHIHIVDLLPHSRSTGVFNLPAPSALP